MLSLSLYVIEYLIMNKVKLKNICIIPARGGSKGLHKKNLRILAGKPLIYWPIRAAKLSGVIDRIFVSTDDYDIATTALSAGAEVPFLRDPSISQDLTTTEVTLQESLISFENFFEEKFDICVFLTATDVFRDPHWISQAILMLEKNHDLESVFSASRTHKNFWHKVDGSWERVLPWMQSYSNRQIRQPIFREDTGLACASRATLWREGRRIGDRVALIENDHSETAIDIHTEFDLYLAECTIDYLLKHYPDRVKVFREPLL